MKAADSVYVALLDEAFWSRSWHGTNLRGAIRGLAPSVAAWRPADGRYNIWEIVVHAAYWKYAVRRRLTGEGRGTFPLAGSNWWPRPLSGTAAEWRADVALLVSEHRRLREAVAAFPPSRWSRRPPSSPWTFGALVRGAAAHDLHHAGQVQLLKRLAPVTRGARA
ncbi:MAG: DinB family protein [Vicinamibacterales bacterium]